MSKVWNPLRQRPTGSEQQWQKLPLVSTPEISPSRATWVGIQPVTNTSPPGTPIAPIEGLAALNPVQTDAWLELVEIVFGEPFSPET